MKTIWKILLALHGAGFAMPTYPAAADTNVAPARPSIPYIPTDHDTVREMLWMGEVGTNDVVYDLGSGDGRVVISAVRDFHARRAVGIEIDPKLLRESREAAEKAGVADRVEFIEGDLFTRDFSAATVLTLYLGHEPNIELRSKIFRTLKPGSQVVSHHFGMGEWLPDKKFEMRRRILGMYSEMDNYFATNSDVPDHDGFAYRRDTDTLVAWVVPAAVAGVWRGPIRTGPGEEELKLALHQRLSSVTGGFEFVWPTNVSGTVQTELRGDHLRLECLATNRYYSQFRMFFDGRVTGDTLQGRVWISDTNSTREFPWTATRDKADFTGTWEWTGPWDKPVQLHVERRDGRLAATYFDASREVPAYVGRNKPIPIEDFYDFGGGIYFTLLLGREATGGQASYTVARLQHHTTSRRLGREDGWVIGEAICANANLVGTIAFYPYPMSLFMDLGTPAARGTNDPAPRIGRQEWVPKKHTR